MRRDGGERRATEGGAGPGHGRRARSGAPRDTGAARQREEEEERERGAIGGEPVAEGLLIFLWALINRLGSVRFSFRGHWRSGEERSAGRCSWPRG